MANYTVKLSDEEVTLIREGIWLIDTDDDAPTSDLIFDLDEKLSGLGV